MDTYHLEIQKRQRENKKTWLQGNSKEEAI